MLQVQAGDVVVTRSEVALEQWVECWSTTSVDESVKAKHSSDRAKCSKSTRVFRDGRRAKAIPLWPEVGDLPLDNDGC